MSGSKAVAHRTSQQWVKLCVAAVQSAIPPHDHNQHEEPTMDVANVARAVVLMATVTPEANIQFLTVMATKMPFVGRG